MGIWEVNKSRCCHNYAWYSTIIVPYYLLCAHFEDNSIVNVLKLRVTSFFAHKTNPKERGSPFLINSGKVHIFLPDVVKFGTIAPKFVAILRLSL